MNDYLAKIYVIHYTKLVERKKHILSELKKWDIGIPVEIFEPYDQEEISQLDIIDHFDMMAFRARHAREMKRGEISLCTKYKKILQKIASEDEGEYFLMLSLKKSLSLISITSLQNVRPRKFNLTVSLWARPLSELETIGTFSKRNHTHLLTDYARFFIRDLPSKDWPRA